MTDTFATYDEATQRHIIELGCFIYTKSLEHYRENHPMTTAVPATVPAADANTVILLKQQVENLSTRVFEVREEEYKAKQKSQGTLTAIQSDTDRQIATKTDNLNKKITVI